MGRLAAHPDRSRQSRRHGTQADHHMRTVIHAKSEPLTLKADDAWTSWPDHLDPGTIVEPHLPQAMDHIARAEDFSDASPLACAEPTKGDEIDLSFLRLCLT